MNLAGVTLCCCQWCQPVDRTKKNTEVLKTDAITTEVIRDREVMTAQIRAPGRLKAMAASCGDIRYDGHPERVSGYAFIRLTREQQVDVIGIIFHERS